MGYQREGFRAVTPQLLAKETRALVDFVSRSFEAEQVFTVGETDADTYAELRIGDAMLMIGDGGAGSEPTTSALFVYVPDVDAVYARAVVAGAISLEEPTTQSFGDRTATVRDPFGNTWTVATHGVTAP